MSDGFVKVLLNTLREISPLFLCVSFLLPTCHDQTSSLRPISGADSSPGAFCLPGRPMTLPCPASHFLACNTTLGLKIFQGMGKFLHLLQLLSKSCMNKAFVSIIPAEFHGMDSPGSYGVSPLASSTPASS